MTPERPEEGTIDAPPRVVELDVDSLTLGELAAIEAESGRDALTMVRNGRAGRKLVALWIAEHRHPSSSPSGKPRSWHELTNLRAGDASLSTSPRFSAGPSPTSND